MFMRYVHFATRALALFAYAVWVGGFTFYSAVVLWVVHDAYGSLESGQITQKVTENLNLIGVGSLIIWAMMGWLERKAQPKWARNVLYGLWALSAGLQGFLFIDHRVLDDRLALHGLDGFYAYHSVYLYASTAQWVVHLLIVPVCLWLFSQSNGGLSEPDDTE